MQFTHPGGEHCPSKKELETGTFLWNYGPHRRKFLKATGQYVVNDSLSPKQKLLFWGEWEPTSHFYPASRVEGNGVTPHFIHEPFLCLGNQGLNLPPFKNEKNKERQNTDPFVFADNFLYCCCKQRKKMKGSNQTVYTQMGQLGKGSIVLFGSTISAKQGGPYFVLDTVFVVGDYLEYIDNQADTCLKTFVSKEYRDITGFANWPGNRFTCYKGASFSEPVDGMFSFVPCRPYYSEDVGFPRVVLSSKEFDFLSDNLNAAPKYQRSYPLKQCWNQICQTVKKQGFMLGVNFEYQYL